MGINHTPQLEDGYVRIATEWFEEFVRAPYPGAVKEFVLAIVRETWGWNETWRAITVGRIADILNVSQARVKQLRDDACACNLVEWEPGHGPGNVGRYRVQKDYSQWVERRKTGSWSARATGKDALSGKDAITGKDVVASTGEDALSGNRQGRTSRLIDKDRQLKTEERCSPGSAKQRHTDYSMILSNYPRLSQAMAETFPNRSQAERNDFVVDAGAALDDRGCRISEDEAIEALSCADTMPAYSDRGDWWVDKLGKAKQRASATPSPAGERSPFEGEDPRMAEVRRLIAAGRGEDAIILQDEIAGFRR